MTTKLLARLLPVAGLLYMNAAMALTPTCNIAAGENKVSWPSAENPTWEMCWVKPSKSSGPRGSGLEVRNVHFRGVLVMKRAHSPMLFAEYRDGAGGGCYRDWKDEDSKIIAEPAVRDVLGTPINFSATTNCDVSSLPTTSYGPCPFGQTGRTSADCTGLGGVAIENLPFGLGFRLTTQYSAGWYKYTSRYEFLTNGNIDTNFGFGNSDGTYNNVTHWHQNYWRFDFDIEGAGNDSINIDDVPQTTEFSAIRSKSVVSVSDSNTSFGYTIAPGPNDSTFPANESGRNFHSVDLIATAYKPTEYSDKTNNALGDCAMNAAILANNESIDKTDVVLYYRASVRDTTANNWALPGGVGFAPQDSMVCKRVGPTLQMTGTFPVPEGDFRFFKDGAE